MCGIFGFITRRGDPPDIARLRRIALVTQTRGEHAFGLAWLEERGPIQTLKRPGAAQSFLVELQRCRDAVVLVGHCRYATHGSPLDNRNNHPHSAGAGFLVHNGVVRNHAELARQYHLRPRSACDSEVLGLLMAHCRGTITQRAAWAATQAAGDLALLGLWRQPARLLVARRGRPLQFGEAPEGFYFGSLPLGLPGRATAVCDHSARVVAYERGRLRFERERVDLAPLPVRDRLNLNHPNTL